MSYTNAKPIPRLIHTYKTAVPYYKIATETFIVWNLFHVHAVTHRMPLSQTSTGSFAHSPSYATALHSSLHRHNLKPYGFVSVCARRPSSSRFLHRLLVAFRIHLDFLNHSVVRLDSKIHPHSTVVCWGGRIGYETEFRSPISGCIRLLTHAKKRILNYSTCSLFRRCFFSVCNFFSFHFFWFFFFFEVRNN